MEQKEIQLDFPLRVSLITNFCLFGKAEKREKTKKEEKEENGYLGNHGLSSLCLPRAPSCNLVVPTFSPPQKRPKKIKAVSS